MKHKHMTLNLAMTLLALSLSSLANAQATAPIAGCTPASFVEGTADNMIQTNGASYTPKCLHVKVGAKVTIQASGHHPLSAMPDIEGAVNPFAQGVSFTAPETREFLVPGLYGYFCQAHGDSEGDGMAGVIWVE